MFPSVCFSLAASLHTQHNFYISLLLPSREKEQVAREGGVVVITVHHPCIGPQLHIDHISHLQQQRSSIRRAINVAWLFTVSNDNMFFILMERDSCSCRCMTTSIHKYSKVVDTSDWSREDTYSRGNIETLLYKISIMSA